MLHCLNILLRQLRLVNTFYDSSILLRTSGTDRGSSQTAKMHLGCNAINVSVVNCIVLIIHKFLPRAVTARAYIEYIYKYRHVCVHVIISNISDGVYINRYTHAVQPTALNTAAV
jgi:hypothetical protein